MTRIAPGSVIGILGGGQLGRMAALAAARLGYRCHVFCPEADSPAAQVSAAATIAGYDDPDALDAFSASIDVATFEFENVPCEAAARIAASVPVRPGLEALRDRPGPRRGEALPERHRARRARLDRGPLGRRPAARALPRHIEDRKARL